MLINVNKIYCHLTSLLYNQTSKFTDLKKFLTKSRKFFSSKNSTYKTKLSPIKNNNPIRLRLHTHLYIKGKSQRLKFNTEKISSIILWRRETKRGAHIYARFQNNNPFPRSISQARLPAKSSLISAAAAWNLGAPFIYIEKTLMQRIGLAYLLLLLHALDTKAK